MRNFEFLYLLYKQQNEHCTLISPVQRVGACYLRVPHFYLTIRMICSARSALAAACTGLALRLSLLLAWFASH